MPKPRKKNTLSVKRSFIIFCEGEKTEIYYLKGFIAGLNINPNLATVEPIFIDKTNPIGIVTEACKEKRRIEKAAPKGCKFWVAFDRDQHPNIPESFNKAKDNNINIAFSSSCFELWFLLHYITTPPVATLCRDLLPALKENIPDYTKNKECIYEKLCEKTSDAKKNATRLNDLQNGPIHTRHPFTNVNELLDAIEAFKEENNL